MLYGVFIQKQQFLRPSLMKKQSINQGGTVQSENNCQEEVNPWSRALPLIIEHLRGGIVTWQTIFWGETQIWKGLKICQKHYGLITRHANNEGEGVPQIMVDVD